MELTQRYFYTIHNTVADWKCGNAIDLYALVALYDKCRWCHAFLGRMPQLCLLRRWHRT